MADDTYDYLGSGIVAPFRRDGKDDFTHETGLELVNNTVGIILGTLCAGPVNTGEVPYNQGLGTLLPLLRHSNINDPTTEELATHYVADKVPANEPRIRAKEVAFRPRPEKSLLAVILKYDVVKRDTTGISVVAKDIKQEYEI